MESGPIDYDALQRRAMHGIVRQALERAIPGMPDGHFFQLTFKTRFPGVKLPPHLLQEYPDAMMIRLRADYWDLEVTEDHFAVGLLFRQKETRIEVPFDAIRRFEDPPAAFSLWLGARSNAALDGAPLAAETEDGSKPEDEAKPSGEASSADVVSLEAFRRRQD